MKNLAEKIFGFLVPDSSEDEKKVEKAGKTSKDNKTGSKSEKKISNKNIKSKENNSDIKKVISNESENVGTSKGVSNTDETIYDWEKDDKSKPKLIFKKTVEKKLRFFLIENSEEVLKLKEQILKIAKNNISAVDYVCVLRYGKEIEKSEIYTSKEFETIEFINDEFDEEIRLYDALSDLEVFVSENYLKTKENLTDIEKITEIEIVGIGTGKDNGSIISKTCGITRFANATKYPNVTSKYFAISDCNFIDVSELGFRSIGAILRKF